MHICPYFNLDAMVGTSVAASVVPSKTFTIEILLDLISEINLNSLFNCKFLIILI